MKLHLGCGKRQLPGFVHVDLIDLPHIDYRHRVDVLPIFDDASAELIYASHVLEYFDREEARATLAEWHRVLKPQGTLRVAVPDFEALIEVYRQTNDLASILGPLYGRMHGRDGSGDETVLYHKTVFDLSSLKALLEASGFVDVHRYDWRETIHRSHDDHSQASFPHMDKDGGLLISLNVQAVKGA